MRNIFAQIYLCKIQSWLDIRIRHRHPVELSSYYISSNALLKMVPSRKESAGWLNISLKKNSKPRRNESSDVLEESSIGSSP